MKKSFYKKSINRKNQLIKIKIKNYLKNTTKRQERDTECIS